MTHIHGLVAHPATPASWTSDAGEPQLVSVILPTRDRIALLPEALGSIADQSYRPIEAVVIDDESGDETPALLAATAKEWESVPGLSMTWMSVSHRGAAAARNAAIRVSSGDFIQYLDSDDVLHPDKLTLQMKVLEETPNAAFVYSPSAFFHGEPDWLNRPHTGLPTSHFFPRCLFNPPWAILSGLYRRNTVCAIGPWSEDLPVYDDWEYCVRFLLAEPTVVSLPGTLSLIRLHDLGRLEDLYETEPGLHGIVRAVLRVERLLRARDRLNLPNQRVLARRFASIAFAAAGCGLASMARDSLYRTRVSGASLTTRLIALLTWMSLALPTAPRSRVLGLARRAFTLVAGTDRPVTWLTRGRKAREHVQSGGA